MKRLNVIFGMILMAVFFYTVQVFAQATGTPPDVIVAPTAEEVKALIAALGGLKGASTLVIIAFVVQALMLLFRSKLGEFAGKYRLLVLTFLTLGAGIVALKVQGLDWIAVLFNSTTLAAFQVFIHQLIKQFFTKKGDVVAPVK